MSRRIGLAADLAQMALGSPLFTGCSAENTVAEQVFNPAVHAPSAKDYIEGRNAKFRAGPYRGAIADYNKVLPIDPQLSAAYDDRSHAKDELGDQRGAPVLATINLYLLDSNTQRREGPAPTVLQVIKSRDRPHGRYGWTLSTPYRNCHKTYSNPVYC